MTKKLFIPDLDNFLNRYIAGESENKLAHEIGIARGAFRLRLLRAGITPRNQSESETLKWNQMPIDQRTRQVKAAHDAARGREVTFSELCLRAKMREGNLHYNVSPNEIILGNWLSESGINIIHNLAVGPYNCDLGTGSITVEVWGGGWHPKPIEVKRTKYILDSGYAVLLIDLNGFPITRAVSQYVSALLEETSSNPTAIRQYWMVRGDGELIFKRFNDDNISLIPPFTSGRNPANGQYQRIPR